MTDQAPLLTFDAPQETFDNLTEDLDRKPTLIEFAKEWRLVCTTVTNERKICPSLKLCITAWRAIESGSPFTGYKIAPTDDDIYVAIVQ